MTTAVKDAPTTNHASVAEITTPIDIPLKDNSVETLIAYRNAASQRIDAADERLNQMERAYIKLLNKRASDARWARKLNKIIIKKALKDRPHRVA